MKVKRLLVMKKKPVRKEFVLLIVLLVLVAIIVGIRMAQPEAAATVNGKDITNEEVTLLHNQLSKKYENVSREDALDQAIDEALLMQEAEKKGIIITDAEIEKSITDYKAQTGISDNDLRLYWEAQGIPADKARQVLKKQQTINRLLNETILSQIKVTDEEAETYAAAFREQVGNVGGTDIVFEPTMEEIKQAIYVDRAKNALTLYLNQLRASAKIELMQ